jgi:hypothetical protein
MKIISKITYRSKDRKINQTDDMIKLELVMTRKEYYNFINKITKGELNVSN